MVLRAWGLLCEADLHHVGRGGAPPLGGAVLLVDDVGAVRARWHEGGVGECLPVLAAVNPRAARAARGGCQAKTKPRHKDRAVLGQPERGGVTCGRG